MTQPTMMTYEEVRAALDAGKALHMDNDGNIVGIAGEMELPPFEPDIRDAAGWAEEKAEYDRHMAAGDYDLAAEDAGEWRCISGDAAFWDPLIDAAALAWREACRAECLDHLRDDVSGDSMDWLRELDDSV